MYVVYIRKASNSRKTHMCVYTLAHIWDIHNTYMRLYIHTSEDGLVLLPLPKPCGGRNNSKVT